MPKASGIGNTPSIRFGDPRASRVCSVPSEVLGSPGSCAWMEKQLGESHISDRSRSAWHFLEMQLPGLSAIAVSSHNLGGHVMRSPDPE